MFCNSSSPVTIDPEINLAIFLYIISGVPIALGILPLKPFPLEKHSSGKESYAAILTSADVLLINYSILGVRAIYCFLTNQTMYLQSPKINEKKTEGCSHVVFLRTWSLQLPDT